MIKSRRMRWAVHVARMGRRYWWKSQKEREHKEDQNVGGSTILKWILEIKWDDMAQDNDQWRALVSTVMNDRAP
jgi:hypothetical protein